MKSISPAYTDEDRGQGRRLNCQSPELMSFYSVKGTIRPAVPLQMIPVSVREGQVGLRDGYITKSQARSPPADEPDIGGKGKLLPHYLLTDSGALMEYNSPSIRPLRTAILAGSHYFQLPAQGVTSIYK